MKYMVNISTDDSSYGDCTVEQIEAVKNKMREICENRGIETIEVDPMLVKNYVDSFETEEHPDSEKIFEEAIYSV